MLVSQSSGTRVAARPKRPLAVQPMPPACRGAQCRLGKWRRPSDRNAMTGQSRQAEPSPVPRLALSKAEAAIAIGCSVDYLDAHVLPELRIVRRGRKRLIAVAELQRWLAESAERVLDAR